jgi:hypothetical protein
MSTNQARRRHDASGRYVASRSMCSGRQPKRLPVPRNGSARHEGRAELLSHRPPKRPPYHRNDYDRVKIGPVPLPPVMVNVNAVSAAVVPLPSGHVPTPLVTVSDVDDAATASLPLVVPDGLV